MKKVIIICLALAVFSTEKISAQCFPVFNLMPQPPNTINVMGNAAYNWSFYALDDASGFQFFENGVWTKRININHNGTLGKLCRWNGKTYLKGRMYKVGNLIAPKGKYMGVVEYNNGVWDSVPGCTFDSIIDNNIFFHATAKNLYYSAYSKDPKSKEGSIFKYDTTTKQFVKIIDYERSTYGVDLRGTNNRLLIAKVVKINNKATNGFCYIDNDSIKLNTDSRFNASMIYGIDDSNDRIYAFKYADNPTVLEFDNSLIKSTPTQLDLETANGFCQISEGKIIWVTYDRSNYKLSWINVLCPGENRWNRIFSDRDNVYYGNPIVTKDGAFVWDRINKQTLKLGNGVGVCGRKYIDIDSNCVYDSLVDFPVKRQLVNATSKGFVASCLTDENGNYAFTVVADTFTFHSKGALSSCADSVAVADSGKIVKDLPTVKPNYRDLRVKNLNGFSVRWNSQVTYYAELENLGLPSDSAHFEFKLDSSLKINKASANVLKIKGNLASGKVYNLGYYDTRIIKLFTWIDTASTKPDSTICHNVSAYLYDAEIDSTNNTDSFCQRVVYSKDPNYKDCNRSVIPKDVASKLEYYIEFQNEGGDDAIDVVLEDELSESLSLESFSVIGASHPYTLSIHNRMLRIQFDNVNLKPKKENEALSKGFFKFSIYTIPGLKEGDTVKNKAAIFFDLNKPVITNTSMVVVPLKTSIDEVELGNRTFIAYPNPTNSILKIKSNLETDLVIYGLDGKVVYEGRASIGVTEVDLSHLSNGMYFIRCGEKIAKIIKVE